MSRRITYEDVRRARKQGRDDFTRKDWLRIVVERIACSSCGAGKRERCHGPEWPHEARRKALIGLERRELAQRQQRRRVPATVTTRFICPLCGGPHPKQDHVAENTAAEQQRKPENATSPAAAGDGPTP